MQNPEVKKAQLLNFFGCKIESVIMSIKLEELTTFILSFNQLSGPIQLMNCPNLERLDLSYNLLTNVNFLQCLIHLRIINLNFNSIFEVKDFSSLNELTHLREFSLFGNPIAERQKYRYEVSKCLTKITYLDNKSVS